MWKWFFILLQIKLAHLPRIYLLTHCVCMIGNLTLFAALIRKISASSIHVRSMKYFVYTNVKEEFSFIFMAMYIPPIVVLSQPAQRWSRLVLNISTRTSLSGKTLSFVSINLHRCWPREWKRSIYFDTFSSFKFSELKFQTQEGAFVYTIQRTIISHLCFSQTHDENALFYLERLCFWRSHHTFRCIDQQFVPLRDPRIQCA